jgi:2-dehydro-3-deoxy-D-arabinonate dehydratase
VGHGQQVRIRRDATWNVPEPELVLVINSGGEIVGYTVGNDMSSRDIEGENPLYLPQAKTYNGSCAVGPGIQLTPVASLRNLNVKLQIKRGGFVAFIGDTFTNKMKRTFEDLAHYLVRELDFPHGVLLMTGTGIVPSDNFTLNSGDVIRVTIGDLALENTVA